MLKGIPNPSWMSEITEYFNFTEEVKGSEELDGREKVSQKTNKDGIVIDIFWRSKGS